MDNSTAFGRISFIILCLLLILVSASNLWFMVVHRNVFLNNFLQITMATRIVTNVLVTEMRNVWCPECWRFNAYTDIACFGHLLVVSLASAHMYHMHGMPLPMSLHIPIQLLQIGYTLSRTPMMCAKEPWLESLTSQLVERLGWEAGFAGNTCPGVLCLFVLSANLVGTLSLYVMEILARREFLLESRPLLWGPLQWPMGNSRFTRWFLFEWPLLMFAATILLWSVYLKLLLPTFA
eukprot:jgi/Botrbrau1/20861/Bobra.0803s0001.1